MSNMKSCKQISRNLEVPRYLYHVTDTDSASKILKSGLIPDYGYESKPNSKAYNLSFLCDVQDVPYWSILLNKNSVLQIDTSGIDISDFDYDVYPHYNSWFTGRAINPEHISWYPMIIPKSDAMAELCEEYIFNLSGLIANMVAFADHPDEFDDSMEETLIEDTNDVLNVIENRLNFNILNKGYIMKEIDMAARSGQITMCSTYHSLSGNRQFWEQIAHYDLNSERLKEVKDCYERVHKIVKDKFPWAREVHINI